MNKKIGGRIIALIPAIILQAIIIILLVTVLKPVSALIYLILGIIAIIATIYIISEQEVSAYKQVWMLFILTVPIFGILMYLLFGNKKTGTTLQKRLVESKEELDWQFPKSNLYDEYAPTDGTIREIESLYFVNRMTGMEVYRCGNTKYYSLGDYCFDDLLDDLKKARKYIFIEYFILTEGKFLNSITDILIEKAQAGVDVRIMYDDLGSIATYSMQTAKELMDKGIKVVSFNPITYITPRVNNRDHRKMTIIDGEVAYSGGINLADEYINIGSKYGHWKDLVFRLEGDAVINYTYMFIEFWNAFSNDKINKECLPVSCSDSGKNGYVLSYYENPLVGFHISNALYIDFLSQAKEYIWFYTPYLMLDDSLMNSLLLAARRGVDVRIILPGVPDKKTVYRTSRSYYGPLLKAGVRIFEYTPGFVHAKACICDGVISTIGTVNLDFRSLFLHFENNSIFYGSSITQDLYKDMEEIFGKCLERKEDDGLPGTKNGIVEALLRVIAPLM